MFRGRKKLDVGVVLKEIAHARRRGQGIKCQDWHLELPDASELHSLVEAMVSWCRVTLGGCRRPYGIDLFDLIIAYRAEEEERTNSFRLEKLRPMELYQDPLPQTLLERFTQALSHQPSKLYVSAAFFSWGDAAHQALPVESPPH